MVENIAGVGGVLGVDRVAKSAPDGYTLCINSASPLVIAPYSLTKIPYDVKKDFAFVTLVVRVPEVVAVHPSVPAGTLADLISYARANPGKVNFGSAGSGSITHLAGELLEAEAKVDLVHVPYKGAAPAVNDLLGGQVQMGIFDVPVLLGHIRSGKLKALAITSATRAPALQCPRLASSTTRTSTRTTGTGSSWPPRRQPTSSGAFTARRWPLKSKAVEEQFSKVGGIASPGSPQEYAKFIASEQAKWSKIVQAIGFKE